MTKINMFDLWVRNWENASRFFQSKGNTKTRSKLKEKWYKEFKGILIEIEQAVKENLTKYNSSSKKDCYNPICAKRSHKCLSLEYSICNRRLQ